MKPLLMISMVLALAAPVGAETYSWLDDSGTFHFTEDLSRVPKKYRAKVRLRGDMSSGQAQEPAAAGAAPAGAADIPRAAVPADKGTPSSADARQLYGGKTESAWRTEFAGQERELKRLEGELDRLRKLITSAGGVSRERLAELSKEYHETRAAYDRKYTLYGELVESARKAGLTVDIK